MKARSTVRAPSGVAVLNLQCLLQDVGRRRLVPLRILIIFCGVDEARPTPEHQGAEPENAPHLFASPPCKLLRVLLLVGQQREDLLRLSAAERRLIGSERPH